MSVRAMPGGISLDEIDALFDEKGRLDSDDAEALKARFLKRPSDGQTEAVQAINVLASMSAVEYDKVREAEAEKLGIRVSTLDAEVKKARGTAEGGDTQGAAVDLADAVPWPSAVDGAEVLDAVRERIGDYIALPAHADVAVTLWATHAHCFDVFIHSPRLNAYAPEKGCGKTQLLDVLATLTPKSLRVENLSTAVLFRLIDKSSPTLLIDECDSHLKDNEELRGALNSGHKRGGVFMRCEGDANEVRAFRVFAPVALAGIGELPGTLKDRSIVIRLKRAMKGEIRRKFDMRHTEHEDELRRKLARWAIDHSDDLKRADPDLPDAMHNRVADNWRPLIAIADAVGGRWPKLSRDAAAALNSEAEDDSIRVRLLSDIHAVFASKGVDRLSSADLVGALNGVEDAPWAEFDHGKPMSKNKLSRLLKPFGVVSNSVRIGNATPKGYHADQFRDAFGRYLPEGGSKNATTQQRDNGAGFSRFENATADPVLRIQKPVEPSNGAGCGVVAFSKGGCGERDGDREAYSI